MELITNGKINEKAILKFFKETLEHGTDIQSIVAYKGDELLFEAAPTPYTCKIKGHVYSLSKSFTSTAIGILIDEGKLSLEDRIVDIFPEKCPEKISENLSKMRIKHILSMNTGHGACVMPTFEADKDGVTTFLSQEVKYEPGTHFAYNTGATYVLSAVVSKITGESLLDFVNRRVFSKMGITGVRWRKYAGDVNEGGVGIFVSCEDIAKLGKLYLNKGVYNGERIISEKWVNLVGQPHSDNSGNGTPDWTSGYGYQFWTNHKEGFRGDGAHGQLCVILPKHNMVIAVKSFSGSMQKDLDCVYDLADEIENATDTSEELREHLNTVYKPASTDSKVKLDKWYKCEREKVKMTNIHMTRTDDILTLQFSDGEFLQEVNFGNGEWLENKMFAKGMFHTLVRLVKSWRTEELHFVGSYTMNGEYPELLIRYLDNPHIIKIEFEPTETGLDMKVGLEDHLLPEMRVWHLKEN